MDTQRTECKGGPCATGKDKFHRGMATATGGAPRAGSEEAATFP